MIKGRKKGNDTTDVKRFHLISPSSQERALGGEGFALPASDEGYSVSIGREQRIGISPPTW